MASIQEVANAAQRIGEDAKNLAQRSLTCSDTVAKHADRLLAVVQGSKSGEQAVQQVAQARAAIRESAIKMTALNTTVQAFISDLTK